MPSRVHKICVEELVESVNIQVKGCGMSGVPLSVSLRLVQRFDQSQAMIDPLDVGSDVITARR